MKHADLLFFLRFGGGELVQILSNKLSSSEAGVEFYSDSRAGDVRFRSIDFRLRPAGVPQGGWCHKGCQNIAILMRISDMYSNLP